MTTHVVPDELDGQRADVALGHLLDVSRSQATRIVRDGTVTIDGRTLRASGRVRAGQRLEVSLPEDTDEAVPPPPVPPIRWQDEHLLVLAKPAGLVVHPGAGHPAGTLVDALVAAAIPLAPRGGDQRPGIVHRLDRDTSGLMVVASTDRAHAGLVDALRRRDVHRRYLALVAGRLPATTGRVDAPIGRDPRDRQRFAAVEDGKPAVTHWQVLAEVDVDCGPATLPASLLACRLETGRTHQIRVHLSFAGAPVIGDRRYGGGGALAGRLGLERPFLHAAHLSFTHPVTGEQVSVDEAVPEDLARAAHQAGVPRSALVAEADPGTASGRG